MNLCFIAKETISGLYVPCNCTEEIKKDLEVDSTEFKKLQIALKQGLVNLNEINEHYNLTKDIVEKLLNY